MADSRAHREHVDPESRDIGPLFQCETWWRDRYDDIDNCGYRLRPRYHPRWASLWRGSNNGFPMEDVRPCNLRPATMMDAIRRHDGQRVMLKKVLSEEGPHELQISRMFSSEDVVTDPRNHCVPLLKVIELSERSGFQKLMVFPFLRPFDRSRIQTFGGFASFFTQICEGIQFMHRLNVAHRNCTAENIAFSRSKAHPNGHPSDLNNRNFMGAVKACMKLRPPPRYYLVGFEPSVQYPSRDTVDEPWHRGDTLAPEHQSEGHSNPFHTDIYYLGNLVSREFVEKCNGFEFMGGLVTSMTQDDPAKRPQIEHVLQEFYQIRASLSKKKLRSAITSKNAPKVFRIILQARQSVRTVWYIVTRRPAIPL
ncbi:hypothetical protein V8E53_004862 [Lactarius tabidus]